VYDNDFQREDWIRTTVTGKKRFQS